MYGLSYLETQPKMLVSLELQLSKLSPLLLGVRGAVVDLDLYSEGTAHIY